MTNAKHEADNVMSDVAINVQHATAAHCDIVDGVRVFTLHVHVAAVSACYEWLSVEAVSLTTVSQLLDCVCARLGLSGSREQKSRTSHRYTLCEQVYTQRQHVSEDCTAGAGETGGRERHTACEDVVVVAQRVLSQSQLPVYLQLSWNNRLFLPPTQQSPMSASSDDTCLFSSLKLVTEFEATRLKYRFSLQLCGDIEPLLEDDISPEFINLSENAPFISNLISSPISFVKTPICASITSTTRFEVEPHSINSSCKSTNTAHPLTRSDISLTTANQHQFVYSTADHSNRPLIAVQSDKCRNHYGNMNTASCYSSTEPDTTDSRHCQEQTSPWLPGNRAGVSDVEEEARLAMDHLYFYLNQQPLHDSADCQDLCLLVELSLDTLLSSLRRRFLAGYIYTYVNSILIAVNPFKYYPIYNPKYVRLYQNCTRLCDLPPHVFAIADCAYQSLLRTACNQCIVISGESGSGKTESTNFLLHHLTSLSHKGVLASGVEQTLLAAGPVLEAFGNAKTSHNNNSSRFGKFIQVLYRPNGQVYGAIVQKYLLERSRIVSQACNERNYHVFYYLIKGLDDQMKCDIELLPDNSYNYLSQTLPSFTTNYGECYEFSRLCNSMEMVGFNAATRLNIFSVLSAILHIGNLVFQNRTPALHHDESVSVCNTHLVEVIARLLQVPSDLLMAAFTHKRARASGEIVVINYRLQEVSAARDTIAKCIYAALFDWIVSCINTSLNAGKCSSYRNRFMGCTVNTQSDRCTRKYNSPSLTNQTTQTNQSYPSIGVLDIFGFEDFGIYNSFEQFCINYANEHLQFYFNQHVFKYEQEEYLRECINWQSIEFCDNTGCLQLYEHKIHGLLTILDDQSNFPGASNDTLLEKFNSVNRDNSFYETPQKFENAFLIRHYAGRVKYQVTEFREKNVDLMRADIVTMLKSSRLELVRQLAGTSPTARFYWHVLRIVFRAVHVFSCAAYKQCPQVRTPNSACGERRYSFPSHRSSVRSWSSVKDHIQETNLREASYVRHNFKMSAEDDQIMKKAKNIIRKGRKNNYDSEHEIGGTKSGISAGSTHFSPILRKTTNTVSGQFQHSLQSLMLALNQANPYFIRCIKSNSGKNACTFDDETVSRQLRYTGMLETVRIRQCGYSIRYTYEEFARTYSIILPKHDSLRSSIQLLFDGMSLPSNGYQLGVSRVFMREHVKQKLELNLHHAYLAKIITIQRWTRATCERRRFLLARSAVIKIQSQVRCFLAQRFYQNLRVRHLAATLIQKVWRGYKVRKLYRHIYSIIVQFQARIRGHLFRQHFYEMQQNFKNRQSFNSDIDSSIGDTTTRLSAVNKSHEPLISNRVTNNTHSWSGSLSDNTTIDDRHYDSEVELLDSQSGAIRQSSSKLSVQCSLDGTDLLRNSVSSSSSSNVANRFRRQSLQPHSNHTSHRINSVRFHSVDLSVTGDEKRLFLGKSSVFTQTDSDLLSNDTGGSRCKSGSVPSSVCHGDHREERRQERKKIILEREKKTSLVSNSSCEHLCSIIPSPSAADGSQDQCDVCGTADTADMTSHSERHVSCLTSADTVSYTPALSQCASARIKTSTDHNPDEDLSNVNTEVSNARGDTHHLRRISRFPKYSVCLHCGKFFASLLSLGFKCTLCNRYLHASCVAEACKFPCEHSRTSLRTHKRHKKKRWSLHGTSEFTDREDKVICDSSEFQSLAHFISDKIHALELQDNPGFSSRITPPSPHDNNTMPYANQVFVESLKQLRINLISSYSLALRHNQIKSDVKYRDIIENFATMMESVLSGRKFKDEFPITMGINGFRGYLDEYMSSEKYHTKSYDKNSTKKRKNRRKQKEFEVTEMLGHKFISIMVNIPTVCEICSSFLWLMERAYMCQNCRLTCHKKCQVRISLSCSKEHSYCGDEHSTRNHSLSGALKNSCADTAGTTTFDDIKWTHSSVILERLFQTIEIRGLYTEGLYRKSGVSKRVVALKSQIEHDPEHTDLDDAPIHVLTSTVKAVLRSLPQPLLTYALYNDFIRATSLSTDIQHKSEAVFTLLSQLPSHCYSLLERLLFHLAQVANHETETKMSPNALAIIFAPCILRPYQQMSAQDVLRDVSLQSQCVELMVAERLQRLRATLADIETLDCACNKATYKLTQLGQDQQKLVTYLHEMRRESSRLSGGIGRIASCETNSASDDDILLSSVPSS